MMWQHLNVPNNFCEPNDDQNMFINQKGQSLVEFILLLSIVAIISLSFLKIVNGQVADYWLAMAQMLIEDPNQTLNLR